jgi:hypothetical protein
MTVSWYSIVVDCKDGAAQGRWWAEALFLDTRIAVGDRVLLSVPKGDIRPASYLSREIQYLTSNGYRWTNSMGAGAEGLT